MRSLMPPHVAGIHPYVPGKPVEEVERELGIRESVKLASNENPLGPSPRAVEAIRSALPSLHLYPHGDGYRLRVRIAERLGLDPAWVILGNGSTEIIEIVAKAFLDRDDSGVVGDKAFLMYEIAIRAVNGNVRSVPFRGMTHDLPALSAAVDDRTKLVYLANPNNPTGTYNRAGEFAEFLNAIPEDVIVVVDEAYHEYMDAADYPDVLAVLKGGRENLLVLRTFSKIYGLAGLRIGYGIGAPRLLDALHRVRSPFNTSSLAQIGGMAALEDEEFVARSREINRKERCRLYEELCRRGFGVTPSVANFHLVDLGADAEALYARLLREGVIVRTLRPYRLPTSVRITVGTPSDNDTLLRALDRVIGSERNP